MAIAKYPHAKLGYEGIENLRPESEEMLCIFMSAFDPQNSVHLSRTRGLSRHAKKIRVFV